MSDTREHRKYGAGSEKPRSTKTKWIVLGVLLGILAAALISGYLFGNRYFSTHFSYGMTMNGESLYKRTMEDVKEELSRDTAAYSLTIHERTSTGESVTEVIKASDIGLELVIGDELQQAMDSQNGVGWICDFFRQRDITITSSLKLDNKKWQAVIDGLQCFQKDFIQVPVDASLTDYQEGIGYEIIPEVVGNDPKKDNIEKAISDAVWSLTKEIDLEDYDSYKEPHVTSDNQYLTTKKENLEKYTNVVIKYTFGENEEVLDGNTISQWISIDEETNEVTLDEKKVSDYIATLRKRYDTIFRKHTFETSYGETVVLEGGDYGWWMNYTKEAQILTEMIKNGESGDRTPEYYQKAASFGENDYGDSYVEVNLTAQHLFVYKDGEMVYETDVVTGKDTESRRTPEGVYGITYKERYAKLVGEDYASPVYYWMPFNGSIGLHDATWRSNFGSDIYKGSGSHGCVNLPCEAAKEIFSLVTTGMAVIVYSLPGTESDSGTSQDTSQIAQVCIDAINALEAYATSDEQEQKSVEWCRQFYNELSGSAKSMVTNYDMLVEAEERLKE